MTRGVVRVNMRHEPRPGASPFERLGAHFDEVDRVCPDCGFEDADGRWTTTTTGDRVSYRHVCPSCGSIRKRTLDVGDR